MSQTSFRDLTNVVRMALEGPEATGSTPTSPGAMVTALQSIWARAEQAANDINCEAEAVGLNYVSSR